MVDVAICDEVSRNHLRRRFYQSNFSSDGRLTNFWSTISPFSPFVLSLQRSFSWFFFTFPNWMITIFQHTLSLILCSGCCWCCKRGALCLFFVARLRAISIRVWRQKQLVLYICYSIEPFTEHSEVDTGSFASHEWATSFSCPVLTSLWHCPVLPLSLCLPRSWIVSEHSRNSTLFSQTWSMRHHH